VFDTEAFVIGAGPFGLSISAHLSALGVDHRIAGRPMDTWRAHMPDGMLMKSEPYASTIASPDGRYDVEAYCRSSGLQYVERLGPLTRERFLNYADWYTKHLVADIQDESVTEIAKVDGGFRLSFAAAKPVTARQVVVATGVLPYRHVPAELAGLPSELVTHTADHHDLGVFQGMRVAVVGAGQSALETAALLHEAGVEVQVIARTPVLSWNEPNPAHLSAFGKLKRPVTQLCEGWRCYFWNTPSAFRVLPENYRIRKAKTVLGPSGAWWLRDRFDGVVDALPGHRVREAVADGSRVKLLLDGPSRSDVTADHVIAGTGFRVDLTRLSFLPDSLRSLIKTLRGHPVVSREGQTSVPGLYFAGAPNVLFVGPSSRFVAGTHTLPVPLTRSIAHRARAAGNGPSPAAHGTGRGSGG